MSENVDPLLLIGQIVLRAGKVSAEQLASVLHYQDGKRIGDRMVERGLLDRDELEALIRERDSSTATLKETVLGELAVRNGFLNREQLTECLARQEQERIATGTPPRLGEILVEQGLVQQRDIDALLARQESLLQNIVAKEDAARESQPRTGHPTVPDTEATTGAPVGDNELPSDEEVGQHRTSEADSSAAERRSGFIELLFPQEAGTTTCQTCGSSANSPLAVVCEVCGNSLLRNGKQKRVTWGLRAGFVVLAGLTGVFGFQGGPFVIAAVLFLLLGGAMLRNYRPSQRYFLISTALLFGGVYVGTQHLGLTVEQIVSAAMNPVIWNASWGGISLVLAALALPLIIPLDTPIFRGVSGILLLLIVLLGTAWTAGGWLSGRAFPLWAGLALGGLAATLAVLMLSLVFVGGFRAKTRRPGVIIEATRPFLMPTRPERQPCNLSEMPAFARGIYLTIGGIAWSGRMSAHYMLSGIIHFLNGFAYWAQLTLDLFLRSLVRAWRRLIELTKELGKVIAGTTIFMALAFYRLAIVVILPLVSIAAGAVVTIALANKSVVYITSGRVADLAALALYAAMLFLLCVTTVCLLMRCHPSSVVIKDAFQVFSFHLPNFLMLILGTSIVLSLFTWATKIGPYRFGPLSLALSVLVVILLAVILYKGKKKGATPPQGQNLHEAPTEHDEVS